MAEKEAPKEAPKPAPGTPTTPASKTEMSPKEAAKQPQPAKAGAKADAATINENLATGGVELVDEDGNLTEQGANVQSMRGTG